MADAILMLEPPFPGDLRYCVPDLRPELRFHIRQEKEMSNYLINDRLTGTRTVIEKCLLENPDFDVSYWCAEQRAQKLGLTDIITHHHCMGDAISIVSTKLLIDGIASSYPCTNYRLETVFRFHIQQRDQSGEYVIQDHDLELETTIPKLWLEDPEFDLVSWYRRHIGQHGFFEQKYRVAHPELSPSWETLDPDQKQAERGGIQTSSSRSDQGTSRGIPSGPGASESSLGELSSNKLFEKNPEEEEADYNDLPDLDPLPDDSDMDKEDREPMFSHHTYHQEDDSVFIDKIQKVLTKCQPFPGDGQPVDPSFSEGDIHFLRERWE